MDVVLLVIAVFVIGLVLRRAGLRQLVVCACGADDAAFPSTAREDWEKMNNR